MNQTFTIQFKSLTCGPCALQGEWFEWDCYPISTDANQTLKALAARYPGQYEWRVI